jgi:hypothetical protein
VRLEDAVLRFVPVDADKEGVFFAAQLNRGAGPMVREAALAEEGAAEWEVGRDACRARVVGGEFVFLRADLHGVDRALDV